MLSSLLRRLLKIDKTCLIFDAVINSDCLAQMFLLGRKKCSAPVGTRVKVDDRIRCWSCYIFWVRVTQGNANQRTNLVTSSPVTCSRCDRLLVCPANSMVLELQLFYQPCEKNKNNDVLIMRACGICFARWLESVLSGMSWLGSRGL